jgi:hypothetical protein
VEVDHKPIATGVWSGNIPLSTRNQIESGQGYLGIRSVADTVVDAGEVNTLDLEIPLTFSVGDYVRVRARAVSAMGVESAWTDVTDATEITEQAVIPVAAEEVTFESTIGTTVEFEVE